MLCYYMSELTAVKLKLRLYVRCVFGLNANINMLTC